MRKILLALLLITITGAFLILREHHRVVNEGSFRGFTIGMTKPEVYDAIRTIDTNAISSFVINSESAHSIEEFQKLDLLSKDGIGVSDFGLSFILYFEEGVVKDAISYDVEILGGRIGVGDTAESVRSILLDEYKRRPKMRVSSQQRGYGENYSERWVGIDASPNSEALQWLFSRNAWSFRPSGTHQNFDLFFDEDRLAEIDYRNYFIELP